MNNLVKIVLNVIPRNLLTRLSFVLKPLIKIYLFGKKHVDPIDNSSFRKFLPYGYNKIRVNALSPSTFSLERHRLLWLYLKRETDFFNKKIKVLHFAPEAAFLEKFKKLKNISYDTIDLNSPLADIKADICNLPINSDSYDFILCNHVLEHVYDDELAIKELHRVLKKKGVAILQVPLNLEISETIDGRDIKDGKKRNELFGQYDHLRTYGKDFFKKIESKGFEVKKIRYADNFTEYEIEKYGLVKGEVIPVCQKI